MAEALHANGFSNWSDKVQRVTVNCLVIGFVFSPALIWASGFLRMKGWGKLAIWLALAGIFLASLLACFALAGDFLALPLALIGTGPFVVWMLVWWLLARLVLSPRVWAAADNAGSTPPGAVSRFAGRILSGLDPDRAPVMIFVAGIFLTWIASALFWYSFYQHWR